VTDAEALKVKVGDRVIVKRYGARRNVPAVVVEIGRIGHPSTHPAINISLRVRCEGTRRRIYRRPWQVIAAGHLEPLTANVYADWLDENGEHGAADKLRRAFPLSPPDSVPAGAETDHRGPTPSQE
jgi:hypothetical protein